VVEPHKPWLRKGGNGAIEFVRTRIALGIARLAHYGISVLFSRMPHAEH
jgi:hypothetical protein